MRLSPRVLKSPRWHCAFTANHAHIVPKGITGFVDALDIGCCDEVRLADCRRNGKDVHLKPGAGDLDSPRFFRLLDRRGFEGHYMSAFGNMQDMIAGREYLARTAAH